jgi:hypothetical protein
MRVVKKGPGRPKKVHSNSVDLSSTSGILSELEEVVNSARDNKLNQVTANVRLRGCKHAIQILALSYAFAQSRNIKGTLLPHLSVK